MALKQNTYMLFGTPYIESTYSGEKVKVFAKEDEKFYIINPSASSGEQHTQIKLTDGQTIKVGNFSDISYDTILVKYKELIKEIGKDYVQVHRIVDISTIITPQ